MGDTLVESADGRIGGIVGAEVVSSSDELFGGIREVGDVVADVAGWDVVFCCCEENSAELGFTSTRGGGHFKSPESLLRFPGEGFPVRFLQVGKRDTGNFGGLGGVGAAELDQNGKVIGI